MVEFLVASAFAVTASCPTSDSDSGVISKAWARGDYETIVAVLEPCAKSGDVMAEFSLGYYLVAWLEDTEPKDKPKHSYADGLSWISKAAQGKLPRAANLMYQVYKSGKYGVPKNEEASQCWLGVSQLRRDALDCMDLESVEK